ncbi:MAG: bifunctional hydroxymethylpyrimidine kinase/phosphomethylpyrimidine kinase [Verrucomicrobiales bacterium]|nr:bifunctional hydroxymethylpyrimidine kinase/phosphomethylpyrimidine kinase [Verrucomicrobiales bacterium]
MSKRRNRPIALTIAGSDSGGGAGIQADLKTFAALAVHGTTALTCVTAQNPKRLSGIQACQPEIVRRQIEAVFSELTPAAVKTGMLFSAPIIRVVTEFFQGTKRPPLVVDPVMIATSGGRLLQSEAQRSLDKLLGLATLITPNLDEAEALTGLAIRCEEDLRKAARRLHERFGCAALVKGGHLRGCREAIDIFYDGPTELLLAAPFIKNISTHGTGCTYSAAIAAFLALGVKLPASVRRAKQFISQAIGHGYLAAGHFVLNSFWAFPHQRP